MLLSVILNEVKDQREAIFPCTRQSEDASLRVDPSASLGVTKQARRQP